MEKFRPRLVARGLKKTFRTTVAVDGVDLELRSHEILGLIGPNGAGKSTTAKMLTGQLLADAGEILVDDRPIMDAPIEARRLTGYVPQETSLYPFLTGREILQFVAHVRQLPKESVASTIEEILDRFALADAQHRLTREYSTGMARKLAIASALLGEPALLVLDESLAGLDPRAAADVKNALSDKVAMGTAVVLVSHQLDTLERLCHRVIVMDHGRVVAELNQEELESLRGSSESLESFYLQHTASNPPP
jgi:ABC-2 type transport system ATP-binding protein